MTRPIIHPRSFELVAAPSKSRPQLDEKLVRLDVLQLRNLMGISGVGGLTEIRRGPEKGLIRTTFGPNRVGLKRSDCPIVWTNDWKLLAGSVDFGCARIPIVSPIRNTTWALLQNLETGFVLGAWFTHMAPGGFARRPSRAQARVRPLIQSRWENHYARIQHRTDWLLKHADGVVGGGDINHPGVTTWDGLTRISGPGLMYLGVSDRLAHAKTEPHRQHADHDALSSTLTPKE